MKCLVTGGAGFIGTNLIKRLLKEGHKVVALDNYSTGYTDNEQSGCSYFDVDLRDVSDWEYFMEKPDVIFHLAALARIQPSFENPIDTFETNVNGTLNILEYARQEQIPVVYAGSSSYHGGVYANPYTYTKWQGEELCRLYSEIYDLPTIICRFYNVYGPHQVTEGEYCTVVGIFERQYSNNETLTITWDGEQRRDFTHVNDIVDGLYRSMRAMHGEVDMRFAGETFELGSGKNYSINELASMFGEDYPTKLIPKRDGEMRSTLCDHSKAEETLGWKPKEDIKDYITSVLNKDG
tara:strand:+ start:648 stop:1529 length:882 start_codon:yes stop_codon:yes gene_type:complete